MRMARPVADIEDLCGLQEHLLSWYDTTHRLLPWRCNKHSRRSPPEPAVLGSAWTAATVDRSAPSGLSAPDFAYGVMVSEVMLQQTQVARAQDYFIKWVRRWPSARSLAAATPEEVNAAWAGLGYYRRARYLLDGAKYAATQPGSVLPTTCAQLRKVPGIGPYTAAAVASIAYGERVAAVDGNVVRVVSRLLALRQEAPASSAAVKEMQALVRLHGTECVAGWVRD
jgi:A/G-specific adenine glycosylase